MLGFLCYRTDWVWCHEIPENFLCSLSPADHLLCYQGLRLQRWLDGSRLRYNYLIHYPSDRFFNSFNCQKTTSSLLVVSNSTVTIHTPLTKVSLALARPLLPSTWPPSPGTTPSVVRPTWLTMSRPLDLSPCVWMHPPGTLTRVASCLPVLKMLTTVYRPSVSTPVATGRSETPGELLGASRAISVLLMGRTPVTSRMILLTLMWSSPKQQRTFVGQNMLFVHIYAQINTATILYFWLLESFIFYVLQSKCLVLTHAYVCQFFWSPYSCVATLSFWHVIATTSE